MTTPAPLPDNEKERLAALQATGLLDTLPEAAFDDLVRIAAGICGVPISLVSLVDESRQWFKARFGLEATQTPREQAFCSHAILQPCVMVVPDAMQDERFRDNPLVTGAPGIRFYAGAPLEMAGGQRIGTLCVIDTVAREISEEQRASLAALARQAVAQIELRLKLDELEQARQRQQLFERQLQRFNEEMAALVERRTQELKQARDRAELYFDAAGSVMVVADAAGRVVRANRRASEVLQRPVDEVVGHDWFDLSFPEPERASARAFFSGLVFGDRDPDCRFHGHVRTADGELRVISWHTTRLMDGDGLVCGLLGVGEDITTRLATEEQLRNTLGELERSNLSLQQFVHVASHDLREPINSILNFARLLRRESVTGDPARRERFVDFIVRGGERLRDLVDDLLTYVRLDGQSIQANTVNLAEVAEDIRQSLADAVGRSGATLHVSALPVVRGDRSLLGLLLQNLIDNAIKFRAAGQTPVVSVEAMQQGDELHLIVTDNGIGIAHEFQQRIFDAFQRLHARSEYEGTGLGLALCRRIAQMHDGRLFVESSEGSGSRFVLALPASRWLGTATSLTSHPEKTA